MADDEEIHNTTVRTVLGSSRREHRWDLAHEVDITTVLGKSFFDLRLARPMGETDVEISISCFLGSVELLVPVGTRVTLEGSTFLAGASSDVSGEEDAPPSDEPGVDLAGTMLPRLDISATAVLGRVRVRTPDRPERARPQRFARFRRKKAKATPARQRALADILAETDAVDRRPVVPSRTAPAYEPIATYEPAPAPTHHEAPTVDGGASLHDADIVVSASPPEAPSARIDADITRTTPATDAGPVDMTFTKSEPSASLDDFDPADFPDDAPVPS